jgi:hypothetical protein
VQLEVGFGPRVLSYWEKRKIMERETKREKRERQNFWVFSEVYGLLHKLRRICDT